MDDDKLIFVVAAGVIGWLLYRRFAGGDPTAMTSPYVTATGAPGAGGMAAGFTSPNGGYVNAAQALLAAGFDPNSVPRYGDARAAGIIAQTQQRQPVAPLGTQPAAPRSAITSYMYALPQRGP